MDHSMNASRARTTRSLLPSLVTDHRSIDRVPVSFGLMYSGVTDANVIMGDGTVIDLSPNGLGVRGNQVVAPGMDLTVFLYLPDQDEPLFVIQAQVAWTSGHRFGVRLLKMRTHERQHLHAFLRDRTSSATDQRPA